MLHRALLLASFLLLAAWPATGQACDKPETSFSLAWRTLLTCEHPLCGTGLRLTQPTVVSRCELAHEVEAGIERILRGGGIAVIGEVHDNAAHHRLRSDLLTALQPAKALRPAVVFEHIRVDQQPALEQFRVMDKPGTAADLLRLLEWERSGWPDQQVFEPLFAAALAAKLPILPGDPVKGKVRDVARKGLDTIAPQDRARLRLDIPLPAPLAAELDKELKDNHCGMLPDSALPGLARAQHFRDAHLADALIEATGAHGSAILIAGNGHIRADRGVPWHLRQRIGGKPIVSVMLIEVEDGRLDPQAYVPRDPDGTPAADFIVFTPRTARPDPCAEMRRAYRKP